MNYQKIYDQIISRRMNDEILYKGAKKEKNLNYGKHDTTYCESHHIKPRCMFPELIKEKSNIVNLFAKEHYIAHELLIKIYNRQSLIYALWKFAHDKEHHKVTAREYERIRAKVSEYAIKTDIEKYGSKKARIKSEECSKRMMGNNYFKNDIRIVCEYCNKEINYPNYKTSHGDKCKKKPGNENNIKHLSEERRMQLSTLNKNQKRIKCEWCHMKMIQTNYVQYHGDNCKMKPGNENIKRTNSSKGKKRGKQKHPHQGPYKKHSKEANINQSTSMKNQKKLECPYCHRYFTKLNFGGYHGEKCKERIITL